jgi:hypothetical protein
MIVVVTGVSAAIIAVVLHGIVVRRLPRRMRIMSLAFFLLASVMIFGAGISVLSVAITPPQLLLSFVLTASLVVDYAIIFTAIAADSPTLSLIGEILDRGVEGLPHGAIGEFITRRPFVQSRIDALMESGMLVSEGSFFVARGNVGRLIEVAEFYRRLCGYQAKTG